MTTIFNPNKKLRMKHYLRRYKNLKYTNLQQMVKGENEEHITTWSYDKIKKEWTSTKATGIDTESFVNNVGKVAKIPDNGLYTHFIYNVPPDQIHVVSGENGYFKDVESAKFDTEPNHLPFKKEDVQLLAKVIVKAGSEVPVEVEQYDDVHPVVDNEHERLRNSILELRKQFEEEKEKYKQERTVPEAKGIKCNAPDGVQGNNVQDVILNVYDVVITSVDSLLNLDKRVYELENIHL